MFLTALLIAFLLFTNLPVRADSIEDRIETLLRQMTLEEKAGQLNLVSLGPDFDPETVRKGQAGAVVNFNNQHLIAEIDAIARSSRLGIPLLIGLDIVHGYRTIFPPPLGLAASFDPNLLRRVAEAQAQEARAIGLNWTFSPMADVARDVRWGRIIEGTGEDAWLGAQLTQAQVEGYRAGGLATAVKHFIGYSAVEGGRDYDATRVVPTDLHDVHLPSFRAAIAAGSEAVMTALTSLNGVPVSADADLLVKLLRKELDFGGVVLADWQAVEGLIAHGVARDGAEAARKAFLAGVDVDMTSGLFVRHLPDEVRAGRVTMAQLDAAVRRVLRMKLALGLFERPAYEPRDAAGALLSPSARALARAATRASLVLLQNRDGLLPIDPARTKRIAVVGPLADAAWDQLGPHEGAGRPEDTITILKGLETRAAAIGATVTTHPGCDPLCRSRAGFASAVAEAREADLIVAVLGEPRTLSGEGSSRAYLTLPGFQQELLAELAQTGRPVILVLIGGRPLELGTALQHAGSVLMAWFPGTEGGSAVAEVLFGDESPAGRLPITWPRTVGQLPLTYDRLPGGRPHDPGMRWTLRYADESPEPLFPFGFGLSYTQFAYGKPELQTPRLGEGGSIDEELSVRIAVTNTGQRPGREVAQLYIRQPVARRSRPTRLLRGMRLVELEPGQTRTVIFRVPLRDLGFHDPDGALIIEPGQYQIFIGSNSAVKDYTVVEIERHFHFETTLQ
ncbi:glycoside hydrolase family 3 N-terminal domain-containing protein [Methylobacterium nodulans]|uniref:beta-glucosidase n=1 Tax=Methylobacterium nodulans (strain LMG 21967 / CNCM I-2342 / ORS 2060) TaxID=460265 RepID=B8IA39_METNO|nr:glycoside hydrolase family 3 N-terminal domain-containing protein [Methylobacterium nodulans]ACL57267.1 glycoside hydrolase family 3 domain protein [Methylobacterium nodulans ORS 2060]